MLLQLWVCSSILDNHVSPSAALKLTYICHKYLLSAWLSLYFRAFNNVWSNIGYVIMGVTFIIIVAIRLWSHMRNQPVLCWNFVWTIGEQYIRSVPVRTMMIIVTPPIRFIAAGWRGAVYTYSYLYTSMCALQLLRSCTLKECHNFMASTLQWVIVWSIMD